VIPENLANPIILRLELKHSPEPICGGLVLTGQQVNTRTIYRKKKHESIAKSLLMI
jgi:hypothetical protein